MNTFYRTSPSDYFWILRLFSFRTEGVRRAHVEEDEIIQRDIEEKSNNLVKKQDQVDLASVVKTSTSLCCSGKSRALKIEAAAVAVENGPTMKSLN